MFGMLLLKTGAAQQMAIFASEDPEINSRKIGNLI